ncbi:hypothetical protein FA13DRAFT_1464014 [Coprinellus micaceus]|uniref:Uncharacterized protein n=1 Tax=Coprinellus micaceus TaxID=71717 RepID=A0A4Y7SLW5_COPMI|nr:hypothetical protein FA13DRAFT_1464014 [Coprinellus micaceus]
MHSSDSGFDSDGTSGSTHGSGFWRSNGRFPAWRCDPAFGVVHQDGCAVCRHYMSHVVEGSKDSCDSSFQEAIGEREGSVVMRYAEGVEEGRRVQAEKDRTRILKYRSEREDARAKKEEERSKRHRAEDEAKRLRAEMRELQDAFMAMQIAYEEQISALTIGPGLGGGEMEVLRMMELQDALLNESTVTQTYSGRISGRSWTERHEDLRQKNRSRSALKLSITPEPIAGPRVAEGEVETLGRMRREIWC